MDRWIVSTINRSGLPAPRMSSKTNERTFHWINLFIGFVTLHCCCKLFTKHNRSWLSNNYRHVVLHYLTNKSPRHTFNWMLLHYRGRLLFSMFCLLLSPFNCNRTPFPRTFNRTMNSFQSTSIRLFVKMLFIGLLCPPLHARVPIRLSLYINVHPPLCGL